MSECQELQFPSLTGEGMCQARLYLPDDLASATDLLVQIVHGMAEHMARYDGFCRFLAGKGIAVCIHDLPGHGLSAATPDKLGYFGEDRAYRRVPLDIGELAKIAVANLNRRPGGAKSWRHVILGHSMGSLIVRTYIAGPGLRQAGLPLLAGIILSATAGAQPQKLIPGEILAKWSIRRHGPLYKDEFLAGLTANGFLKRIPQPHTPVDWLTRDEAIVDAYRNDPLCGFTFTAAGYYDLCGWVRSATGKRWAARIPVQVPFYLFSGAEDPVSDYGRGARQVSRWLADAGHQTDMKIYPDCRHETLNEINRAEVWQDVANWLLNLKASDRMEQSRV